MKKIIIIFTLLLMAGSVSPIAIKPATEITLSSRTIYNDGNLAAPDSVRIQVFLSGAELFDAWYNSADGEAAEIDDWLIFTDQLQDIDGAGGLGHYQILARAYDKDSTLYTPFIYNFEVGTADTIDAIIDTLQNQDDWIATEVTALKALDSLADVLDSLETQSVWIQDSLYAILDSLQNQDNWIAKEASLLTASDNIGINWGDVSNQGTSVNLSATTINLANTATTVSNEVTADITKISGDGTAADNLETMLDSTGGKPLTVSQIVIESAGNNTPFIAYGSGISHGMHIKSGDGNTGNAAYFESISTNGTGLIATGRTGAQFNGDAGTGISVNSNSSDGVNIGGAGDGSSGIYVYGDFAGLWLESDTTGLLVEGANGDGARIQSTGNDGDGLELVKHGTGKDLNANETDSLTAAIADANKGNFKADVSALSLEATLVAKVDTLLMVNGYKLNSEIKFTYTSDLDTWYVISPDNDTIVIFQNYHPGGAPGGASDSTKTGTGL